MWTHLPPFEEEHREAELQNSHAIPLTHNGPNYKDKAQIPEWSYCSTTRLSYWCTHSD